VRAQADSPAQPRIEQRPAQSSRAFVESADKGDDDDRPTRRPPPVAELAKGFEQSVSRARTEPATIEPDAFEEEPEPGSVEPDFRNHARPADDDEFPTLPPTRADTEDDDTDDEPTIVEPFAYFARDAFADLSSDRPSDDRPTDRSFRAAAPVDVDAPTPPPAIPVRRGSEPRRAPDPPAARVATASHVVAAPIAYPGSAVPDVRAMSAPAAAPASMFPVSDPGGAPAIAHPHATAAPLTSRAVPSTPEAPVLSSRMLRSSQRPSERPKATNFAAGIAALIVVAAAGYLGAMSGKSTATTSDSASPEESAVAKIEPPPPPAATEVPRHDPLPAPPPPVEALPAPRAREVPTEAPSPSRENVRESPPRRTTPEEEAPRPRRTTSDEDAPRVRTPSETSRASRTHAPRPPAEEESGNTAPETRLPDSNDAPAARATIDQGALRSAFAEGESKAKACLGATSPTGTARFSVTFAPSGEAVGAVVSGAPFANTLEGQCMAGKFRTLRVPPFTGPDVIVRKSISFL